MIFAPSTIRALQQFLDDLDLAEFVIWITSILSANELLDDERQQLATLILYATEVGEALRPFDDLVAAVAAVVDSARADVWAVADSVTEFEYKPLPAPSKWEFTPV